MEKWTNFFFAKKKSQEGEKSGVRRKRVVLSDTKRDCGKLAEFYEDIF